MEMLKIMLASLGWFLSCFGIVVLVLLAIAALIGALAYGRSVLDRRADKARARAYDKAVRELGRQLKLGHYWFFEQDSTEAADLLKCTGEYLADYGVFDENQIRNAWRAVRKLRQHEAERATKALAAQEYKR